MKLKDLIGKHILSGIEVGKKIVGNYGYEELCNYIKFTIDDTTYMALEDPDDGYRSYMRELIIVKEECQTKLPNISVCCHMKENSDYEYNNILVFVDVNSGKEILEIGTENYDDWYPYCVLEYHPENMFCNRNVDESGAVRL